MTTKQASSHPDDAVEHVYTLTTADESAIRRVTAHIESLGHEVLRVEREPPAVWARGAVARTKGPPPVPEPVRDIVHAVLGPDTEAVMAAPRKYSLRTALLGTIRTTLDLSSDYNFPKNTTGAGQTVGIILLGGGVPALSEFNEYFSSLCLKPPSITVKAVAGATNAPATIADIGKELSGFGVPGKPLVTCKGGQINTGAWPTTSVTQDTRAQLVTALPAKKVQDCGPPTPDPVKDSVNWTCEGIMDIQLLGGIAPGCAIVVYICPNTAHGIYTALTQALTDKIDVLTCSWGSAEFNLSAGYYKSLDPVLAALCASGVTICASSGDRGSTPRAPGCDTIGVSYPASSQYALACGGNMRLTDTNGVATEQVWREGALGTFGASGGGFSAHTPMPAWQKAYGVAYPNTSNTPPMRGVPDVSSESSSSAGIWLYFHNLNIRSAGTSAAAPVWAGLVARINEARGEPAGNLSQLLYQPAVAATFVDVVTGDNSVLKPVNTYDAQKGWDPCTGLGRPDGTALLSALRQTLALNSTTRKLPPAHSAKHHQPIDTTEPKMAKDNTVKLIHFLSDILQADPHPGIQFVQHTYWQDPELVMRYYQLSDDQKAAIKSGDVKTILKALDTELSGFLQAQNRNPDW